MPTTWSRSPEDFHKIYSANTDAFYRSGSYAFARELDSFMTSCALQLWSRGSGITQRHADLANEIYSRNQPRPGWMLWGLTSSVCASDEFMPPLFFWTLAEDDAKRGTQISRTFIRMFTNIMLYLAAADDEVTLAAARVHSRRPPSADSLTARRSATLRFRGSATSAALRRDVSAAGVRIFSPDSAITIR